MNTARQVLRHSPYLEDTAVVITDRNHLIIDVSQSDGPQSNSTDEDGGIHQRGGARTNPFMMYEDQGPVGVSDSVADRIGGYDFNQHCHLQISAPYDKSALRTLAAVSVLTLFFIIGEVTGGAISGSLAIMTDAAHMLSDLASFLISIFAILIARRPATKKMSFGFYRAEVLGAVCSILVIWVLTGILVYLAVLRVINTNFALEANPMLITAAAGVGFNIM